MKKYVHLILGAGVLLMIGCSTPKTEQSVSSFNYQPFMAGQSFVGRWTGNDIVDAGRLIGRFNTDGSQCEGFFYSPTWDRYGRWSGTLVGDQLTIELHHTVKFAGSPMVVKATGTITGTGDQLQCAPVLTYPNGQTNRCELVCAPITAGTEPTYPNLREHEKDSVMAGLVGYPTDKSLPRLSGISQ
jgi:hypothetical protein